MMADYRIGKGVYIWQPESIEGGDPNRIAARLKMAGAQCATIKICDGFKLLPDLQPLFQALRNNQIRAAAWGYSYLDRAPLKEAQVVAEACHLYQPDFYLIDVETEVEGNHGGARMFVNELRPAVAGLPLGLNTFWNAQEHPDFPWVVFMDAVDFVCPQVYWRGVDPVGKLSESQQSYQNIPNAPDLPMPMVAGDLLVSRGVKPTPEQVTEFLTAADADPFIKGVLMWAADDTQTTPDLWQAFSLYQWKGGGVPIPPQPLGWGKVKAPRNLWVRSSPFGAKVDAVAKGELVPIWQLTETRWAAVTSSGDRWVYVGRPDWIEVALESSASSPAPAPAPPGLYQARVVARSGLHVRAAAQGNVLRALKFGDVVQVYEEKNGWGRIDPSQSEWVSTAYLSKIA
jgi:hypothetical protein